jgi:hypothetical protein
VDENSNYMNERREAMKVLTVLKENSHFTG